MPLFGGLLPFVVPTYLATPPDVVVANTAAPLHPHLGLTPLESISQQVRLSKSQLAISQPFRPSVIDLALQTLAHLEMLLPVGLQSYRESTTFRPHVSSGNCSIRFQILLLGVSSGHP